MSYRVQIQPSAADGLDTAYRWIASDSPDHAAVWLHGAFEAEIRQLLYGGFRVLFYGRG